MVSLRQRRNERMLTIRALAEAAKTSPQTIVNIEAGRHNAFYATMSRIAGVLGVEPQEIDEFAETIRRRSEASQPTPPEPTP